MLNHIIQVEKKIQKKTQLRWRGNLNLLVLICLLLSDLSTLEVKGSARAARAVVGCYGGMYLFIEGQ